MEASEIEQLKKEREDLLNLISQLEEEYSKANLTESVYKEAKEKYGKKLKEINKKLGIKEEGEGFGLKKILKKQEKKENPYEEKKENEPVFIDPLNPPKEIEEVKEETPLVNVPEKVSVELEKIKAFIDSLRDMDKTLGEQIRNLTESIGEIRSMVFQVDGFLKELEMKLEKLESSVEEIRPEKIEKRLTDIEKRLDGFDIHNEKTDRKIEDLTGSLKKINDFMKGIKGLENLVKISNEVNEKNEEVKEAIRYIERIAAKVEKAFTEVNKLLNEFVIYKGRQESLEETVREISKNIEEIKVRIENTATLKDLEAFRSDLVSLKSSIDEINKILPIAETKIPETIVKLREERDDILLLLKTLDEDLQLGRISIGDYNKTKENALKKLREINDKLVEEWKRIEKFIEEGGLEFLPSGEKLESEEKRNKEEVGLQNRQEREQDVEEEKKKEEVSEFSPKESKEDKKTGEDRDREKVDKKEGKKVGSFQPKILEPIKVRDEEDLIKTLKKVKEGM